MILVSDLNTGPGGQGAVYIEVCFANDDEVLVQQLEYLVSSQPRQHQQGNGTTDLVHDDGTVICLGAEKRKATNCGGHAEARVCFHNILLPCD